MLEQAEALAPAIFGPVGPAQWPAWRKSRRGEQEDWEQEEEEEDGCDERWAEVAVAAAVAGVAPSQEHAQSLSGDGYRGMPSPPLPSTVAMPVARPDHHQPSAVNPMLAPPPPTDSRGAVVSHRVGALWEEMAAGARESPIFVPHLDETFLKNVF